jgi:hypothetical protein
MKLVFFVLVLLSTVSSFADVYEASSDKESKLDVVYTIEPMVFEKSYISGQYMNPISKKNAQLEGHVNNQTACIRKKGQLIGKTILHRYEVGDAGIDRKSLDSRVISICKFPEIK